MKGLNDKQRKFCELLASGKSNAEAYRIAYRSKSSAATCASCANKLLKNADICEYLRELRQENREVSKVERSEVLGVLAGIMRDDESEPNNRIMAIREINKMSGYYEPEKVEISAESDLLAALSGVATAPVPDDMM